MCLLLPGAPQPGRHSHIHRGPAARPRRSFKCQSPESGGRAEVTPSSRRGQTKPPVVTCFEMSNALQGGSPAWGGGYGYVIAAGGFLRGDQYRNAQLPGVIPFAPGERRRPSRDIHYIDAASPILAGSRAAAVRLFRCVLRYPARAPKLFVFPGRRAYAVCPRDAHRTAEPAVATGARQSLRWGKPDDRLEPVISARDRWPLAVWNRPMHEL